MRLFGSRRKAQNPWDTSSRTNATVEVRSLQLNKEEDQLGLTLLYDGSHSQDDGQHEEPDAFDIIAVHGLQGHPVQSFTNASNGCCWLRDLLPKDLPRSRIFTFGYESRIATASIVRISDISATLGYEIQSMRKQEHDSYPRPLVFIAHNLGGLVVKQLMIDAERSNSLAEVRENTAGVLFFGTPHRGSNSANMLGSVLRMFPVVPLNKELLSVVKTESEEAIRLNNDFRKIATRLTITSFFETLGTTVSLRSSVIVGRDSAIMGVPNEHSVALHAQHRDLCKFADESDPNYKRVLYRLMELYHRTHSTKDLPPPIDEGSMSKASMPPWIPNIASKIGFTSSGLLEMASSIEKPADFSNAQADIIAIHGLGGSSLRSWTSNTSDVMWLRDLLQVKFPDCRVLSYGYRAAFKERSLDIQALASDFVANIQESRVATKKKERPLVLIGYSFGGVIIKQAFAHLQHMSHQIQMRDLLASIKQVVFLGTPHNVDDPSFPSRWTAIIQTTSGVKHVNDFNVESSIESIRKSTLAFSQIKEVHVASIAESDWTIVPRTREKTILATPASVRVCLSDNEAVFVAMGKDHLELPIFDDGADPTYLFICDAVNKTLRTYSDAVEAEKEKIIKALHSLGFENKFTGVPDHAPGTCEWIFEHEKTGTWFQHCKGVLLLRGDPGCGKSCMAKFLVTEVPRRYPQSSKYVANYFCNSKESTSTVQKPLAVLGSLLYQLFIAEKSLVAHASEAYHSLGAEFIGSLASLKQIFTSIGRRANFLFIIDGLDEYFPDGNDAQDFLRLLTDIGGVDGLGFLVTTRPYPIYTSLRESDKMAIVDFSASTTSRDIQIYIDHEIEKSLSLLPKQIQNLRADQLKKLITERAQDFFLYASLLLRNIENASKFEKELQKLSAIPADLEDYFSAILQGIISPLSKDHVNFLVGMLYLLAAVHEPVDVYFLEAAFKAGGMQLHSVTATLSLLRSFVVVADGQIHLMHHSLRLALLNDRIAPSIDFSGPMPGDAATAHAFLARMTITQIYEGLWDGSKPSNMAELDKIRAYAAKNWVVHFREAANLLDASVLNFAYEAFDETKEFSSKWMFAHKELTGEVIPRHRTLGPLFGGCYFGLLTIVERALEQGVDIEAEDQFSKTPLHWSSERGHREIVVALLSNGASVETQGYAGWTALHFAAQNGHSSIVKLLIQSNTGVNIKAFDGKTPLHLAIEFNHIEVVIRLLEAGADPSSETYSGDINAFQLALQYGRQEICQLLLRSKAASNDLLRISINRNSHDMLAVLVRAQADVVKESYPWIMELLEQNVSAEEVSDLLLKSENLNWIDAGSWTTESSIDWQKSTEITHQDGCIHQLDPIQIGREYLKLHPLGDEDTTGLDGLGMARSPSSSGSITSLSDGLLDPLEYFGRLERREKNVIRMCGIGGVFPPNYKGLNPGFAVLSGREARIMYGDFGEAQPLLPVAVSSTRPALQGPNPRTLEHGNGTADLEIGYDIEEDLACLDLLETSTVSDYSYNSLTDPSHFEIWDQRLAQKIARALENVLGAIYHLRNDDGCCESFTVLIKTPARCRVLSMKTISVTSISTIRRALEEYCHGSDSKVTGWTSQLASACLKLLQVLELGESFDLYLKRSLGSTISPTRCLHLAAQIAQICSVGLVTYTRGHSRDFQTDHLSRSIDVFSLHGSDSLGPAIYAQRFRFACMDNMLRRKVWAFCQDKDLAQSFDETFYLSTNVHDLIDTWGGNIMFDQTLAHTFIEIGGGSVHVTSPVKETVALLREDEMLCHWSPQICPGSSIKGSVTAKGKLLIGATCVNENCLLTYDLCQQAIPPGALHVMGTRPPSWKLSSRAVNLGVSAKGFVTGGVTMAQVKDNGKFQKSRMMEKCKSPHILSKPWGLELSLCTGIARRVLLREFFYGEVLEFLAMELAGEWDEIKDVAGSIAKSSDAEFDGIIRKLTKPQAKVMRKAAESLLLTMEYTQVEDDGHTLTLWWPERHEATPRGLKFLKNQYSGVAPWTSMIKESETCAVFGLATPRCLEHHDIKTCRNSIPPAVCCTPENIMLNTYLVSATTEFMTLPLSCALGERLILWKRQDTVLEVTRAALPLQNVVRVKFIPGQRPLIILKRMIEKWQQVLEKQARSDRSQEVLVL